jgi:CBS-domain-containing membrane protein
MLSLTRSVLGDMQGIDTAIPRPALWYDLITMPLGAFLGVLWLSSLDRFGLPTMDLRVLNPTFGATAVLLFAVPESKLAQPRNLLGVSGQNCSV